MKIYYFYHHMYLTQADYDEVKDAIKTKNYEKFRELQKKFNSVGEQKGWGKESFLPSTFFDGKRCKDIKITQENIGEIEDIEWECG